MNPEAGSLEETEEEDLDPHLVNGREAFVLPPYHCLKAPPSLLLLRWVTPPAFLPFLLLLPVTHNNTDARRERRT